MHATGPALELCGCSLPLHHASFSADALHQVLDGELAQRAEATRKLREVQKQLMLLGGLVPPSPVVTAAAAAAAAASRGAGAAAAAAAAAKAALPREEVLQQEAARLQAAIDKHSANVKVRKCMGLLRCCINSWLILQASFAQHSAPSNQQLSWHVSRLPVGGLMVRVVSLAPEGVEVTASFTTSNIASCYVLQELQEQWERARADEQSRGAGAADVKRWTGIRNIIEARELLRTLFMCACAQKAQVGGSGGVRSGWTAAMCGNRMQRIHRRWFLHWGLPCGHLTDWITWSQAA